MPEKHIFEILLFSTRSLEAKWHTICLVAAEHYYKQQPLLLYTPDAETTRFIDELLWKMPPEGCIPHIATIAPCNEVIAITSSAVNVNGATYIFNLREEALFPPAPIKTLYELEEATPLEKQQAWSIRYRAYRDAGISIAQL